MKYMEKQSEELSFSAAFEALQSEGKNCSTQGQVTSLPLASIKTCKTLFQPRDTNYAVLASDAHIKTLAEAIKDDKQHNLEALMVWWGGENWYVIDGHHRLEAYRVIAKDHPDIKLGAIPVEAFNGSLNEAIKEASARNCRDKLPMNKDDKLERAWKLVCLGEGWTKEQIHLATGVSVRTVANMRTKRAEWMEENKGDPSEVINTKWEDIKSGRAGGDPDDDWKEKLALNWSTRLAKAFGDKLVKQPEIAARALEIYSKNLALDLVREWPMEARKVVEELGEDDIDLEF